MTGLLRYKHEQCGKNAQATAVSIIEVAAEAARGSDIQSAAVRIRAAAETQGIDPSERDRTAIEGWGDALEDDGANQEEQADSAWRLRLLLLNLDSEEAISEQEFVEQERFKTAWTSWLVRAVHDLIDGSEGRLRALAKGLSESGFTREAADRLLLAAWSAGAEEMLSDHIIDEQEYSKLMRFAGFFRLDEEQLKQYETYMRVRLSAYIRDIAMGNAREADRSALTRRVRLSRDERLLYTFPNAEFSEMQRSVRGQLTDRIVDRIGRGAGGYLSPAMAGDFDFGLSSELSGSVLHGTLHVTNCNLYFDSPDHAFRIEFQEVVDLEMGRAGIIIRLRGGENSTAYFKTGDGWVVSNVLTAALAQYRQDVGNNR